MADFQYDLEHEKENSCIYDSRVGRALSSLSKDGVKIILCPSEDVVRAPYLDGWAEQYQKLIWTLEVARDFFREKQKKVTISQIEMALFMMGKRPQ